MRYQKYYISNFQNDILISNKTQANKNGEYFITYKKKNIQTLKYLKQKKVMNLVNAELNLINTLIKICLISKNETEIKYLVVF